MTDKQTIWIIDNNTRWAAEVELQLKKDGRTVKIFADADDAYNALDKVFFSSNNDKRPELIITSSDPITTPNLQQFMDMIQLSQVPLIITDYAKSQALVQQYNAGEITSSMHNDVYSFTLPALVDETIRSETQGRARG